MVNAELAIPSQICNKREWNGCFIKFSLNSECLDTWKLKPISFQLGDTTQPGLQEWRSGESTRLPPIWPGFDSQIRRHMWVEFVGSLLCTERFSPGTPIFPSP